jgi:multidrug efflux system membrane fusion protein
MASAFKPSRIVAVLIVGAAALWIASGAFETHETPPAEPEAATAPAIPVQKVAVATATPEQHQRSITLSCVTEADHRTMAVARGAGIHEDHSVELGDEYRAGQTIAVISDEGREAAVKQAEALLAQRSSELEVNRTLVERGTTARNTLRELEAAVAAAQAALEAARAEARKLTIEAPIDGIVNEVPVQVGQAVQIGTEIAEIIDPDPMLAVGAVSERRRGSLAVGQPAAIRFIDGGPANGTVNFVALSADPATRTYRVEARMDNEGAVVADGVTCEMEVALESVEAAAIPRSALVFSDQGEIGVRVADAESKAKFVPVQIVDDERGSVWVTGIDGVARVIIVGQDFVKDGDPVEAVSAAEANILQTEPPA